jgi:hypothetical protein
VCFALDARHTPPGSRRRSPASMQPQQVLIIDRSPVLWGRAGTGTEAHPVDATRLGLCQPRTPEERAARRCCDRPAGSTSSSSSPRARAALSTSAGHVEPGQPSDSKKGDEPGRAAGVAEVDAERREGDRQRDQRHHGTEQGSRRRGRARACRMCRSSTKRARLPAVPDHPVRVTHGVDSRRAGCQEGEAGAAITGCGRGSGHKKRYVSRSTLGL